MDESEKRRERLKAMRVEATETEVSNNQVAAAGPGNLSNPLLESMATPSVPASRFDFYTDPMSAFSSTKKRNNNHSQNHQGYFSSPISNGSPMGRMSPSHSGPRNNNTGPTPNQYQINYSPDRRLYETSSTAPGSCSWRTPTGVLNPFSGHRGTPLGVSGAWNQSGSSSGRGRGHFHNHDYGRGGSSPRTNLGRGSYHQNNSMPSPGSGRSNGRGSYHQNKSMPSPVSGQGNGRGRGRGRGRGGFHAYVSAQEQPELFYRKCMIEDPWRFLQPVVLKSWLPESLRVKKPKISEVSAGFRSHSSLAERLSRAFEEAAGDGDNI